MTPGQETAQRPRLLVVIDPGHGGRDPGAFYDGVKEADLNLALARRLKSALTSFSILGLLTRDDDRFLALSARAETANELGAEIFVSLHCDAASNPEASGFSVHHFPGAERGARLAQTLHRAMVQALPERRDRGMVASSFLVLKRSIMPAALIECEFLSHPASRAWLQTPPAQDQIARAVGQGIQEFFHALV